MTCSIVSVERQLTAVIKAASPFDKLPETQRSARATLASVLPSLAAESRSVRPACAGRGPPAACCRWKSA